MSKIPCKNCVTLAICKAENSSTRSPYILNPETLEKCSVIKEWCYKVYNDRGGRYLYSAQQKLMKVRDYFLRKNNE